MKKSIKLKPSTRKKRADYEGTEQTVLFNWLYYYHREIWEMAFHIPNGGKRNVSEASRLKKQGVKAGYPDIAIDMARKGYNGLRIELKATPPNNCKVSDSQAEWIEKLCDQGYKAIVCIGILEAKSVIREYFDLTSSPP